MRLLYTLILYLITPLVLARLWWRGRALPDYRKRWGERFGFVRRARKGGIAVWVHAVSVGESLAALPLIKRLVAENPPGSVLVTTTTPTGSARVLAALGDSVQHTYMPYDLPGAVARFLSRMRPRKVVIMETELWPNLFAALASRRIPLIVANARLSPRSFKGYSRVRGFARGTLARCTHIAAQSAEDARRFRELGAEPLRVSVMGNIKFDVEVPEEQVRNGRGLRNRIGEKRPVWIAASTHAPEEAATLAAHAELLKTHPQAVLILVPRHPQRFDEVARLIAHTGLRAARRSADQKLEDVQVLLGDSMGEMFMYFGAADIAFVGGSFAPVGGHNVLEPAALGLPVLFGPHMHNFVAARDLLLETKAAEQVADAKALARAVGDLIRFERRRAPMGEAGKNAIAANRGALQRLLKAVASTTRA